MSTLEKLIVDYRPWLSYFNRKEYREHFAEYKEKCLPLFEFLNPMPDKIPAIATRLIDSLEQEWTMLRWRWQARALMDDDRMFFTIYFMPAAMESNLTGARILAQEINKQWNARFPKYQFGICRSDEIISGFKTNWFKK